MEHFSYKGGCGMHVLRHLEVELTWALDKFTKLFQTIVSFAMWPYN